MSLQQFISQLTDLDKQLIVLEGLPGMGKTVVLRKLINAFIAKYQGKASAVHAAAIRGVVAARMGGRTLAWLLDTLSQQPGQGRTAAYPDAQRRVADMDVLIIDEYEELSIHQLQVR